MNRLYDRNWFPDRHKETYTYEEALQLLWLSAIRMIWNGLDSMEVIKCVRAIDEYITSLKVS
jgi:hypothetical protein